MPFAQTGEEFTAQKWNRQNGGEYKRRNTTDNRFGVFLDLSEQAFVPVLSQRTSGGSSVRNSPRGKRIMASAGVTVRATSSEARIAQI